MYLIIATFCKCPPPHTLQPHWILYNQEICIIYFLNGFSPAHLLLESMLMWYRAEWYYLIHGKSSVTWHTSVG